MSWLQTLVDLDTRKYTHTLAKVSWQGVKAAQDPASIRDPASIF